MLYAYQLRAHANARYQQSMLTLSHRELRCMLQACDISAEVEQRFLGGAPFLCFEAPELTPMQRAFLQRLSGLYMTAALEGDLLRPLDRVQTPAFLPQDMPEILKYKGKTNADFTQLMINLALAAGGQWQNIHPRIADPICGKGTALYCALIRGADAVGVDTDQKSLQEASAFTQKWLQYHRIKHAPARESRTLSGGRNAPVTRFSITDGKQTQELILIRADTRDTGSLLKKSLAHALVADLPYGVQHAPRENGRMDTLEGLIREALPAWRQALLPGCCAAIAFNSYTLKRDTLARAAEEAGFAAVTDPLYADFSHWVEQAVNRDVLVIRNPQA